ncbi:MAG TPA: hypothetical protein IAA58_05385 [Candidatus Gallacutalibacter stercoravium]|nr:hypothetical protein [Candidatus Gallacutalibacter stercoravium]
MFTIQDGLLTCCVDFEKGQIASLKKGGKELLCNTQLPLFELSFRDEEGNQLRTTAVTASRVTVTEKELAACAVYEGLSLPGITATVRMEYDKSVQELRWNIAVDNQSPLLLEWVDYPCVAVNNCLKDGGGDGKILWPYNEGVLVDDMALRERSMLQYREPEYPSLGLYGIYPAMVQSQFLALLVEGGGLYIGAHDSHYGLKGIDFCRAGDGIKLQIRLYAAAPAGTPYQMDYNVVYKVFEGDWYTAADIYRTWFEANKSEDFVPIERNERLPAWYGESPVILTYPVRGLHDMDDMKPNRMFPYVNALPALKRISQDTGGKIMALLMHWEGTAPWAPPYVWPPYGGEEIFFQFRDALHQAGNLLGVYCSGIGFTLQSNLIKEYNCSRQIEQENLESIMCKGPDQVLALSNICTGQRSGYDMCPACGKTKEIIAAEAKKICDGGVDYAQMLDQNHGGSAYFCYGKDHGHPSAPGRWLVEEEKELLQNMNAQGNGVLFGCESAAAEPFIPNLLLSDNRFELNYHGGMPVPLYAYIYHKYVNNFMGNQVGLNFCPTEDNLLYRLAYSFVAGDFLTLVLTDSGEIVQYWGCRDFSVLPDYEKTTVFIQNINKVRKGIGKKYLHSGQMLRPFALRCSHAPNRYPMENRDDISVPALLTGCFQASDGTIGQVVVNYNDEAVSFGLEVPPAYRCTAYCVDGDAGSAYRGETTTIDRLSAMLFVFEG